VVQCKSSLLKDMNLDVQQFRKIKDMHWTSKCTPLWKSMGIVIENISTKLIGWLGPNLGFNGCAKSTSIVSGM
jgi:hypothetical protein